MSSRSPSALSVTTPGRLPGMVHGTSSSRTFFFWALTRPMQYLSPIRSTQSISRLTIDPDFDDVRDLAQILRSLDMRRDEDRGSLGGDTASITESPAVLATLTESPGFVFSAAPMQGISALTSSMNKSPHTPPRRQLDPLPRDRQLRRSTRIPDFAQVAHELACTGDSTDTPLNILRTRIVLLAEVKAPLLPKYRQNNRRIEQVFMNAYTQTLEQAQWAFADDQTLSVIGVLLCVGARWSYIEHNRQDLGPVTTDSERKDPTWEPPSGALSYGSATSMPPSPPSPIPGVALVAPFLHEIFGGAEWLELQDAEGRSKKAFSVIIEHLKERHEDLWGPIA
ncbi:hypothetical protein BV25DRAFT_758188 [Artomyces pyxidatus]|uniref:Uncharacterized protein n=1 Tax=Artomyces pyxidatus TaxID=48021 RepID=A0ACB8SZW5_9AGAM|nr:hypothetical protein BV25DRAFT_758188 [Artomyces pyxidatus]